MLIYGCESWNITRAMKNMVNAAENKWLRRILRISYKEHITNEDIRQKTQQPMISVIIRKRWMTLAGHVMRMNENRNPQRILKYLPGGKRTAGRPRRRWLDCLERTYLRLELAFMGKQPEDKECHLRRWQGTENCGDI